MAWKHGRIVSPAHALAQRGVLFASNTEESKGPAVTKKGTKRRKKALKAVLQTAERMRRAARILNNPIK